MGGKAALLDKAAAAPGEAYAKASKLNYLTLTAAHRDIIPLFSEYGFTVESNVMGTCARAMEKRVA